MCVCVIFFYFAEGPEKSISVANDWSCHGSRNFPFMNILTVIQAKTHRCLTVCIYCMLRTCYI